MAPLLACWRDDALGQSLLGLDSDRPPAWLGLLTAVVVVGIATALIYPLKSVAPVISLGVVYIPVVLLISVLWGLWQGLFTALLSAIAFNWFHLAPTGRLTIADDRDVVALVVFVTVAVASSALAEVARARAREAEHRREEADRTVEEMAELSREKDRMQAEAIEAAALRRSDELKTALLRSVSHDLRTPLASMIAAGSGPRTPPPSRPTERHELEPWRSVAAGRPALAAWSRTCSTSPGWRSGNAEPHGASRSRASPSFIEAARPLDVGADQAELRLSSVWAPSSHPCSADAGAARAGLRQPARQCGTGMAAATPVQVRARGESGPRLDVRVHQDQGPGIPRHERERIFDALLPAPGQAPLRRKGPASGLAIAQGFVEANGGEIAVESAPGPGDRLRGRTARSLARWPH